MHSFHHGFVLHFKPPMDRGRRLFFFGGGGLFHKENGEARNFFFGHLSA